MILPILTQFIKKLNNYTEENDLLNLIWAQSNNGIIGNEGILPWKSKVDMEHFKKTTLNSTVVMGHKTYKSIGRPLPKRRNLVMSRSAINYPSIEQVSLEEVLELSKHEDVFIIGGLEIYNLFLPYATFVYRTTIGKEVEGDTIAPALNSSFSSQSKKTINEDGTPITIEVLMRNQVKAL